MKVEMKGKSNKQILLDSLLKLFAYNTHIQYIVIVINKMTFTGTCYSLQRGYVMLYTGFGKTYVGKIPIEQISEVKLAKDILTITIYPSMEI